MFSFCFQKSFSTLSYQCFHIVGLQIRARIEVKYLIKELKTNTAWKVSVFGVFLVPILSHLDGLQRDTEHFSVFSPNAGK